MPVNDELGKRMKTYYEQIPQTKLMRRTPVAIRIDGKAFHTFTKGFQKPFDEVLIEAMYKTMKYLCENIQGCVLGYTQSDEITLILVDYKKLNSSAWFDYEVQKMCSIAASMATMAFNKYFYQEALEWYNKMKPTTLTDEQAVVAQLQVYKQAAEKGAMFDARCFNIPKEEVTNLLYWRQVDAARNSIQMVARAYFSHAECQDKNTTDLQEMLFQKHGINWNDYPVNLKRGACCSKVWNFKNGEGMRSEWKVDYNIPMFKNEGRDYVERLIQPEEE
jgi:tRNA(His) 5'-end guanylyltransferase